jgi:hypothetical protein
VAYSVYDGDHALSLMEAALQQEMGQTVRSLLEGLRGPTP